MYITVFCPVFVPFILEINKKILGLPEFLEKKTPLVVPKKPFVPARPWQFAARFPLPKPDAPGHQQKRIRYAQGWAGFQPMNGENVCGTLWSTNIAGSSFFHSWPFDSPNWRSRLKHPFSKVANKTPKKRVTGKTWLGYVSIFYIGNIYIFNQRVHFPAS